MCFALFNIEYLTVLAYSFRDTKIYALFLLEALPLLAYYFRASKSSPYFI